MNSRQRRSHPQPQIRRNSTIRRTKQRGSGESDEHPLRERLRHDQNLYPAPSPMTLLSFENSSTGVLIKCRYSSENSK
jgi:hypothetical protein